MKNRLIMILLICTMAAAGCAKAEENVPGEIRVSAETEVSAASESVENTVSESGESTVASEISQEPGFNMAGGKPWIDTCVKENIAEDMEISAKDDFYFYVNREWIGSTQIPEGMVSWDAFSEAQARMREKLEPLMTDTDLKGHDAALVQDLYRAVTDWDARNALGVRPMAEEIEKIRKIGSMEELSDYLCDPDKCSLVPVFLRMGNSPYVYDSSKYILNIALDSPLLGDAGEYSARTQQGNLRDEANRYLVKEMLGRCGFTGEEALRMYEDAIGIESKLMEGGYSSAPPVSKDDLSQMAGFFPALRLIEAQGYGKAERYELGTDHQGIMNLRRVYSDENLEALKSYMIVKFSFNASGLLDQEDEAARNQYLHILYGKEGSRAYEETASGIVENLLSGPLARCYIEKYGVEEEKERVTKLINQVIDEYRRMLQEEEWLTDEAKQKAVEKLDNIVINAVCPNQWNDDDVPDLKGLSFWDCLEKISRYRLAQDNAHTEGSVDRGVWLQDTLQTNAYYYIQYNSINILLGIMNEPFYYDGISDEELYAGLGTFIGHEISHAFDSYGAQYDKDGRKARWWTFGDQHQFEEKMVKMAGYYSAMTAWEGAPINGSQILAEAGADMGGLKVILRIAEKEEGFDYDRFFREYAAYRKALHTGKSEYYLYIADTHPLNFIRTNSVLQQFDEFLETYGIKEGDGMYLAPDERVPIW